MKANWFLALPVDPGRWFAPLVRTAPEHVRVFHPADVHITAAFLGACGEPRARAAWAEVRQVNPGPLSIQLSTLEPMGNPRRPSALSVVISRGREPLAQLIGALRGAACRAADAQLDDRPPLPHLTVARPKRKSTSDERREAIEWARSQPPVDAQVELDRLCLYTWTEDRRERQFRSIEQTSFTLDSAPGGSSP